MREGIYSVLLRNVDASTQEIGRMQSFALQP